MLVEPKIRIPRESKVPATVSPAAERSKMIPLPGRRRVFFLCPKGSWVDLMRDIQVCRSCSTSDQVVNATTISKRIPKRRVLRRFFSFFEKSATIPMSAQTIIEGIPIGPEPTSRIARRQFSSQTTSLPSKYVEMTNTRDHDFVQASHGEYCPILRRLPMGDFRCRLEMSFIAFFFRAFTVF